MRSPKLCQAAPISRAISARRKPVQSKKKSPAIGAPSSSRSAVTSPVCSVALGAGDLRVDHGDAARLLPQPRADQRLVEVIGVVVGAGGDEPAVGLAGEGAPLAVDQVLEEVLLGDRAAGGDREDVEIREAAVVAGALDHEVRVVDRAVVGVALAPPVLVADAELDGRVGFAQELDLVEAELAQHLAEDRGRALADADGGKSGRLRPRRSRRGGRPAGSSPAGSARSASPPCRRRR